MSVQDRSGSVQNVPLWRGTLPTYQPEACAAGLTHLRFQLDPQLAETIGLRVELPRPSPYGDPPGGPTIVGQRRLSDLLGGSLCLALQVTAFIGNTPRTFTERRVTAEFGELPDAAVGARGLTFGPQASARLLGPVLPTPRQLFRQRHQQYKWPRTSGLSLAVVAELHAFKVDLL